MKINNYHNYNLTTLFQPYFILLFCIMHILYILDFYKPNLGWVEVLLDEIINHFWKNNQVSVITWNFNWQLPEIEKKWNITIHRVRAKNLFGYVLQWIKKWKSLTKNVDIIHANTFFSWIIGSYLSKKYKIKSVLHIHGFFGNYRNSLVEWNYFIKKLKVLKFKILEYLNIHWNFNKYICISRFVQDVVKVYYWVSRDKIELVYNWMDYEKWQNLIDTKQVEEIKQKYNLNKCFSLLFFWRIEKMKGLDFFLESLSTLQIKDLKVILIIHWDFQKFEEKIQQLKWTNIKHTNWIISAFNFENIQIEIIPWVTHETLANYIKAVSAVVLPSSMEPFGLAWLETCILWTPIIASNSWAIEEVVFWKVNFFEYWNKKDLQKAILNNYNWIFQEIPKKDFNLNKMFNSLEKIYKELINK